MGTSPRLARDFRLHCGAPLGPPEPHAPDCDASCASPAWEPGAGLPIVSWCGWLTGIDAQRGRIRVRCRGLDRVRLDAALTRCLRTRPRLTGMPARQLEPAGESPRRCSGVLEARLCRESHQYHDRSSVPEALGLPPATAPGSAPRTERARERVGNGGQAVLITNGSARSVEAMA